MNKTLKPWFSYAGKPYSYDGPYFYDPADFPWVVDLEHQWEAIQKELEKFLQQHEDRLEPYFNDTMVNGPKKWKALSFLFWGISFRKNKRHCPETMAVLSNIPHLVSASISMIEADTEIKEHRGDTNAIIRCHLGIRIPDQLPVCGFRVVDEERSWEEGKLLLFNDAEKHAAWNHSSERRMVLILDVMRPDFSNRQHRICSLVLSSLLWQYLALKLRFLKRMPFLIKNTLISLFSVVPRIYLSFTAR